MNKKYIVYRCGQGHSSDFLSIFTEDNKHKMMDFKGNDYKFYIFNPSKLEEIDLEIIEKIKNV